MAVVRTTEQRRHVRASGGNRNPLPAVMTCTIWGSSVGSPHLQGRVRLKTVMFGSHDMAGRLRSGNLCSRPACSLQLPERGACSAWQAEPWPERGAEVHVLSLKVGGGGSSFGSPTFQWLSAEFPSLKPIRPAVRGARRGARQ